MLTRFQARNYKNVECDLELGAVNVLIGPNNSGKSNFLRALGFARDLTQQVSTPGRHLVDTVQQHGEVARRGASGAVELAWWFGGLDRRWEYGIEFESALSRAPVIRQERLAYTWKDGSNVEVVAHGPHPDTTVARSSTASEQWRGEVTSSNTMLRQKAASNPHWLNSAFEAEQEMSNFLRTYRFSSFDPSAIAAPRPATTVATLDDRGRELANVLRELEQSEDQEVLSALTQRLRVAMPDLTRVWPRDTAGTHRWISMAFGKGNEYPLSSMSDGTTLLLALATILAVPGPATIAIDEPELNLHPAWLRMVGRWLCADPKQLVISTHSPDLLDCFTEGYRAGSIRLLVFGRPGSPGPSVRSLAPEELESFLDEGWELGDLYRVGEPKIGGWPW